MVAENKNKYLFQAVKSITPLIRSEIYKKNSYRKMNIRIMDANNVKYASKTYLDIYA